MCGIWLSGITAGTLLTILVRDARYEGHGDERAAASSALHHRANRYEEQGAVRRPTSDPRSRTGFAASTAPARRTKPPTRLGPRPRVASAIRDSRPFARVRALLGPAHRTKAC